MNQNFIHTNIPFVSILLFVLFYSFILYSKPGFLYNPDGSLRQFGVGYKNKTILPCWLLAIVLGVLSYLAVLYYLEFQQYV